MNARNSWILFFAAVALSTGCKQSEYSDNPDIAAGYQDTKYKESIVTGRERKDYADQGKGISPKTLRAIEDTIVNVYDRDFERCLEEQMEEHGTRFMRSVFTVEFTIATDGKVKSANVLRVGLSKQDAKGATLGEVDPGNMKTCVHDSVLAWEFDSKPEVEYTHTYNGKLGEAF